MTPFQPVGIGQNAAKNVFKVTFSQDLSTIPKLKAFDDYNMDSVANTLFVGTAANGYKSLIGGIGCTVAPSASWWPSTEIEGVAVDGASLLNGNSGFCLLASSTPEADDSVYFNLDYNIPYDLEPSDNTNHVVGIEYQYTGTTPTVTWYGNDGGSEGSPSWTQLQPGLKGSAPIDTDTEIRPCNAGEGATGTAQYKLGIPQQSVGSIFPDQIWLKDRG